MRRKQNKEAVTDGIYKRGDRFYIRIMINGELIRRSVGIDYNVAKAVLADLRNERDAARLKNDWSGVDKFVTKPSQLTFAEAAADYLAERASCKPSTRATYNEVLNGYLLPEFGHIRLREISEEHIAKFQSRIKAAGLSEARVNSILGPLRYVLKIAHRRKQISENPATSVDRLKETPPEIDPLSREELSIVLGHVDQHYKPLFTCLAWTGARPNEMLALRWTDVDFRRNELRVNKGRVKGLEGRPKTTSAQRVIPLLPPVQQALEALKQREKAKGLTSIDGHIFTDKRGLPIDKHLDRIWARALKKAGMRHRPSYQLRHTFASICLAQGADPGWIARVLGHCTLQTTFRHYLRYIDNASQESLDRMQSMFQAPKSGVGVVTLLVTNDEKSAGDKESNPHQVCV